MQSLRLENLQQRVRESGNVVKVHNPSAVNTKTCFFPENPRLPKYIFKKFNILVINKIFNFK